MRAVLLVLIIAVALILIAVATGFLDINQIRGAKAPAFDVETGSVKVGSKDATVKVPTLEVQKPQNQAAATTNNAM